MTIAVREYLVARVASPPFCSMVCLVWTPWPLLKVPTAPLLRLEQGNFFQESKALGAAPLRVLKSTSAPVIGFYFGKDGGSAHYLARRRLEKKAAGRHWGHCLTGRSIRGGNTRRARHSHYRRISRYPAGTAGRTPSFARPCSRRALTPCLPVTWKPARPFSAIISTWRLVLGLWPRLPTYRPKVSCGCLAEGKPPGGQPVSDHSTSASPRRNPFGSGVRATGRFYLYQD